MKKSVRKQRFLTTLLLAIFGISNSVLAQWPSDKYLSWQFAGDYSWAPPAGMSYWYGLAWGAGAAGTGNPNYRGGNGGNFIQTWKWYSTNFVSFPLGIRVGASGSGSGGNSGFYFGASPVSNIFTFGTAYGGQTGFSVQPSNPANSYVQYSKIGGSGQIGAFCGGAPVYGGGGGSAYSIFDGSNGTQGSCPSTNGTGGFGFLTTGSGQSGGNGGQPGNWPGGGAGGNNQSAGGGAVYLYYNCAGPGTIGTSHTVPNPQELPGDYISASDFPEGYGLNFQWQKGPNTSSLSNISGTTGLELVIPTLTATTVFRRVTNSCAPNKNSNDVTIKVVTPNGRLTGTVVAGAEGGTGLAGCTLTVQKVRSISGSPQSLTYRMITGNASMAGKFDSDGILGQIPTTNNKFGIYYGDPNGTNSDSCTFIITPSRGIDQFDPPFKIVKLSAAPGENYFDLDAIAPFGPFKDTTVYAVSGKVVQRCQGCLTPGTNTPSPTPITSELEGALIKKNGTDVMTTSWLPTSTPVQRGRYVTTVPAPGGSTTISVSYPNHVFLTPSVTQTVLSPVTFPDFVDTTTYRISGSLRACLTQKIGKATIKFSDVVKDKDGNQISSEFSKLVTTDANGDYAVRLPARKYTATVLYYTRGGTGGDVDSADLKAFFNTQVPKAELTVDVSLGNKVLNLIYRRPPNLVLEGLNLAVCNSVTKTYALATQLVKYPIQIKVYEGNPNLNCLWNATGQTVQIESNFQSNDESPEPVRTLNLTNGIVKDTLLAGAANTLVNTGNPSLSYQKNFTVSYNNEYYTSPTILSRPAVILGNSTNDGAFVTAMPETPLMVVHDPPGDQSFAEWKVGESVQYGTSISGETENATEKWKTLSLGLETDISVLGYSIKTEVTLNADNGWIASTKNVTTDQLVNTLTRTTTLRTSATSGGIGEGGDLFYGTATNFKYATVTNLYQDENCNLKTRSKIVFAPTGFGTIYSYTADFIKEKLVNKWRYFATKTTNPDSVLLYNSYAKTWEDFLKNNDENKKNAVTRYNFSFNGGGSSYTEETESSISRSNSFETLIYMDTATIREAGLKVSGIGFNGKKLVNLRSTRDTLTTNDATKTTTFSFTLQDQDPGDYFSLAVKTDPVYSSPIFVTNAGESSCPPEANTAPRDQLSFTTPITQLSTTSGSQIQFPLSIGNGNPVEERTYYLYVRKNDQSASIIGALEGSANRVEIVRSAGSSANKDIFINKTGNTCSYPEIEFALEDDCGTLMKTISVSANFPNVCSPIHLAEPVDGWVQTSNLMKILFNGYNPNNLTNVSIFMEYRLEGGSNWSTGFTSQANGSGNGTEKNWDVTLLPDGVYNIRMKLVCPGGTNYSNTTKGIIDRAAPQLFGQQQPIDEEYSLGNEISISYNENVRANNLDLKVFLDADLNGTFTSIPITVTGYNNKLVVVPVSGLGAYQGKRIRMIVKDIEDLYGNKKLIPDTSQFIVLSFVASTGPQSVNVNSWSSGLRPGNSSAQSSVSQLLENMPGTGDFQIAIQNPDTLNRTVYFYVGGTATYGKDYTVSFSPANALNYFDGTSGAAVIPKNALSVIVKIDPVADSLSEPDETVILSLSEGGDYKIGSTYLAEGTIIDVGLSSPLISGLSKICPGSSTVLTATRTDSVRFASRVIGFSTQYGGNVNGWSALDVLGSPNVYPIYADNSLSWSPSTEDGPREYLVLGFDDPAPIDFVDVYENFNPGSIDTVYVKNPNTGLFQMVWSGTAAPGPAVATKFHASFPKTSFPVSEVRIAMNTGAVPGWSDIDAVGIGSVSNNASFKWSNGATTRSTTVNAAGSYTCTVTNSDNGLSGKSEAFVVTTGTPTAVYAGADISYDQSSGNKYLGAGSPAGGTWSGSGVTGTTFSTIQTSGVYPVVYCYTNTDGCTACDTVLVTIRPPVGKCDIPLITPGTGTYISTQTVSISCKTPGASIYYTITGNNPNVGTVFTKLYTVPFKITNNVNIRAMAVKSGLSNSGNASVYYTIPTTANPVISPGTGTYAGNQTMTLTSATSGASIYYTLNGNLPRFDVPNSYTKLYTGPVTITGTVTVWAVAKHPNYQYSSNVSATISIPPVRFNPPAGTYAVAQNVTMTNTTAGAQIYYTTNGQTPVVGNGGTTLYTGPVFVPQSGTLKAISWKNAAQDGLVASANYVITNPSVVANPVFTPGAGVCAAPCAITITCTTVGADVYYTTNGNTPTQTVSATNKKYSGPISLTGAATIKAKGFFGAYIPSAVVTASYTLGAPARMAVSEDGVNENLIEDQALDLFPNPTSGAFTIRGMEEGEKATIQIWNSAGKRIYQSDQSVTNEGIQLNVSGFPAGLYHVEVLKNNTRNVLRIVKE